MLAWFEKPIICPVLIGRAAYLESIERAFQRITSGTGWTLLIAGEAGIGKSRLVAEAKARAAQRGYRLLEGHCYEPDHALPYAPLLNLLRGHLAGLTAESLVVELGPAASALSKLLPELSLLLPDQPASVQLEPEQEKRRLFHALSEFVVRLSHTQPLLVVIEDIHWSDDTSLEFLQYFAGRVAARPILLLLTYRDDEPHPALPHFLAELDRSRLASELLLGPLSDAEVAVMLEAIFGLAHPVSAAFLRALYELAEGNPFFVEEVLKSLITAGDIFYVSGAWERKEITDLRIPRTVRDAVGRRAGRLSSAARQLLSLAAVAGHRFDFTLLQRLTQSDEWELLRLLKELIGAQLLVETAEDQFAFRHALTRRAVYAELLARERKALHQRIGTTLESMAADGLRLPIEELAYHFYKAGEWPKALEYGQRAGERARTLFAPRAAVEQFTRALEAAGHLGSTGAITLYRGRGVAYETLGAFDRARADLETALDLARTAGDAPTEWQILLDLGLLWMSRDYTRAGELYQRALDIARAIADPAMLAYSLNWIGNWHMNVERPIAGQQYHGEALAIFQRLDDQRGIAETLDLLGVAHNLGGDLVQSKIYFQQAVALFRELGDRQRLGSSLAVMAASGTGYVSDTVVWPLARPDDAIAAAEEALRLGREIGWRSGEAYALCVLGGSLATQGQYERGITYLRESLAIAQELGHREWTVAALGMLGMLYQDMLACDAARQYCEQGLILAQEVGAEHWVWLITGLLASVCIADHDLLRATVVLDRIPGRDTPPRTLSQRLCWLARAKLALALDSPDTALAITEQLVASAPQPATPQVIPTLWHLRGAALAALQRPDEAEQALQAALEEAAAQRRRPLLWRIHLTLARLLQKAARRNDAQRAFLAARTIAKELTSQIPDAVLRDNYLAQVDRLIPPPPVLTPRQAAKHTFGGLTAREREVAALIAQGKSNRAIAEQLIISERTVEGHVTNILSKLGATTRSQVAAWAVDNGLASASD